MSPSRDVMPLPVSGKVPKSRLLIVDDDPGMRENLAELFESLGYTVLTAEGTSAALRVLEAGGVDLLLTDYKMPGPTGLELIEVARQRHPGLRAILMTAFGDSLTEAESFRRGAAGYMTKPFEADEVVEFVEKILALWVG
jgi:DNA-binding NtrC family response regulator